MDIITLNVGSIGTNCYLVSSKPGECVIIDPGDDAPHIDEVMRSRGIRPVGILLTHGHFDHIGAVESLRGIYRESKVYASAAEDALLHDIRLNCTDMTGRPAVVDADVLLENNEGFELAGIRFRSFSTPGHTAGSACFYVEDEAVLFSGDTLFYGSIGRTDLPTGDYSRILRSLGFLMTLPGKTRVYPGHGPVTTIERELKDNPYVTAACGV